MSLIETMREDSLFWITLNRPDKGNAYTLEMVKALVSALKFADEESEIKVVLLKSAGDYFCTGGDISLMQKKEEMFSGESLELRQNYHFGIQEIPRQFEKMQKPVISLIQGAAVGAGCDLVAMTDLRIASKDATFSESFNRVGLVPGDGGAYFLIRAVGYSKAMEMFMLAKTYSAQEMMNHGLVHEVVEKNDLENKGREFAQRLLMHPPHAVWMTKRSLIQAYQDNLSHHLEMMSAYQALTQRSDDHFISLSNLKNKETRPYQTK
jgi:enoyl-CoA hydratase/carnithine racemase